MIDPAWVDAQITAMEAAKGASCPLRSIPIDLIADAVEREAAGGELGAALDRLVERYCRGYLPPRLDLIDHSDIYSPGGMVTPTRIERDGS